MNPSRRDFLKTGAAVTLGAGVLGVPGLGTASPAQSVPQVLPDPDGDPLTTTLAQYAIDAARSAGAEYADVRVSSTKYLYLAVSGRQMLPPSMREGVTYGVRCLSQGIWGFAAGQVLTRDAVAATAKRAVANARAHRFGTPRARSLAPLPNVARGHWVTPIERDPFEVSLDEQVDLMFAAVESAFAVKGIISAQCQFDWLRDDRTFASTDGALVTQRLYRANPYRGSASAATKRLNSPFMSGRWVEAITPTGQGYEAVASVGLAEQMSLVAEQAMQMRTPAPAEVGQYDLIFHGRTLGMLLGETLGRSLELDRAIGMELDADGSSFAAPPRDVLGTLKVGSPLLTVRGDRSQAKSVNSVGWDDEGVQPREFTFVENGVVMDYHTTRETATHLDWWYQRQGKSVRSNGCAVAGNGDQIPIQHLPNMTIDPDPKGGTLADLIADTKHGIVIWGNGYGSVDQQIINSQFVGAVAQEVRNGKPGRFIHGLAYQFKTADFWRSVDALGGPASQAQYGWRLRKGQPAQQGSYSANIVPARFKNVNVILTEAML